MARLVGRTLSDLKTKIVQVIVLVIGIKFIEKLVMAKEPIDVLWYGPRIGGRDGANSPRRCPSRLTTARRSLIPTCRIGSCSSHNSHQQR